MALADYNLRYNLPFKDVDGNQWLVEISDRDESGSVERLKGTGNPVNIYYEAEEEFTKGIIGSSCQIRVYGTPNMDGTSDLTQFFTNDEERFLVEVFYYENSVKSLYWRGFLHQDEYVENITSDPYEVELVALDRLGTIKTTLDTIGYNTDSEPLLKDLVTDFIDETKLEFTLEESTGLITQNGAVSSYLQDQFITAETFVEDENEFVKMKSITEVVSDMALSMFCRVWQQKGKLMFQSVKPPFASIPNFELPDDVEQIGDNLYARHLAAQRVTNISIATRGRNLFFNPSFERDALLDTTPTGWTKPSANNSASIEVSDEAVDNGSEKSLKTINNRVSDSDFDNASLSQKKGVYTLIESASRDISFGVFDQLQGVLKIRFYINNTDTTEPYEIRFSMERSNNNSAMYYDFESQFWSSSFNYAFFDAESNGEWQEIEIPFLMRGINFYNTTSNISGDQPIIFRIHTMNYIDDGSLTNVQVFYDNMSLKVYNANGDSRTAFLPDTRYYNLSTDDDTTKKTGSIDIELMQGITTAEFRIDSLLTDKFYLMNQKVLGQHVNNSTGDPENVAFQDSISPTYAPLPVTLMNLRRELDEESKKIFSTTLATKRVSSGWKPIFFGDRWFIDYTQYTTSMLAFTRFDFSIKENRYNIDAIKLP